MQKSAVHTIAFDVLSGDKAQVTPKSRQTTKAKKKTALPKGWKIEVFTRKSSLESFIEKNFLASILCFERESYLQSCIPQEMLKKELK